jgi:hypothetical protein
MKHAAAGLFFLSLLMTASAAHAQRIRLGEVLVFNVPDHKTDADSSAFARHVLAEAAPAWKKNVPGIELHLVRADRGSRKGQQAILWTTDLREGKGSVSAGGDAPFASDVRTRVGDPATGFASFVRNMGPYVEYRLLSPGAVGQLPDVEILGIHYIKVRPDRREAFERFVGQTLHPAVANLRPDLRLLYYKAVNAADAGNYITVFALTSASRDKYWPKGSDSDDVRAAFKPVRALTDELRSYLVEGSYATGENMAAAVYESREWTDFVKIAGGQK